MKFFKAYIKIGKIIKFGDIEIQKKNKGPISISRTST